MRLKEDGLLDENKLYHIDIPFSMHTERRVPEKQASGE